MVRSSRLDDFRAHRHRAARLRRSPRRALPPSECPEVRLIALPGGKGQDPWAGVLSAVLSFLAQRLAPYRSVHGLLYRFDGASVHLHVVVRPPMTAAVHLLASGWIARLRDVVPSLAWHLRVSPDRPTDGSSFRCVYWRRR